MNYTKEQISEIISKQVVQRNGLNDLLSIMLESMMMAERVAFLTASLSTSKERTLPLFQKAIFIHNSNAWARVVSLGLTIFSLSSYILIA